MVMSFISSFFRQIVSLQARLTNEEACQTCRQLTYVLTPEAGLGDWADPGVHHVPELLPHLKALHAPQMIK